MKLISRRKEQCSEKHKFDQIILQVLPTDWSGTFKQFQKSQMLLSFKGESRPLFDLTPAQRPLQLLESNNYFGMKPTPVNLLKQETVARLADNDASLSTLHFLKFPQNSFEVLKLLENSVEVLKILENKLESMKILENKLESMKNVCDL
ncbi:hypothetical protein Tco_0322521 [Tanacetum coccineum]